MNNMLPRIILSIFIVVEILTWRHGADGVKDDPDSDNELCSQCEGCSECEEKCSECEREKKVCPNLEKPEHGEINGKCKRAKPGEYCKFECSGDYRLNGDALLFCRSDNLKWSSELPKCMKEEKYCPDLEKPDHGEIINGKCKKAKAGDYCKFECRGSDYRLDGTALIFCRGDNLEWSQGPPKCVKEEKHCPDLDKPDHGEILNGKCKKAIPGDFCNFECRGEYRMHGTAMLVCRSESLEWSNKPPQCIKEEKRCLDLQKPDHGEINGNCKGAKPGEYCKFECHSDYRLDGTALIFCRSDNIEWSHGPPKCTKEEKHCPDLEKPHHGKINGKCIKATPGEFCTFECHGEYRLHGTPMLVCKGDTLRWSKRPPHCIKGNLFIHTITNDEPNRLRIELGDFEGHKRVAKYDSFYLGDENQGFALHIEGYTGNAGDSLEIHNNMPFGTKNAGNINCARTYKSGWWWNNCLQANLNGLNLKGWHQSYFDGINWLSFKGEFYSLRKAEMKIRPRTF